MNLSVLKQAYYTTQSSLTTSTTRQNNVTFQNIVCSTLLAHIIMHFPGVTTYVLPHKILGVYKNISEILLSFQIPIYLRNPGTRILMGNRPTGMSLLMALVWSFVQNIKIACTKAHLKLIAHTVTYIQGVFHAIKLFQTKNVYFLISKVPSRAYSINR